MPGRLHQCPGPACKIQLPRAKLMCPPHWGQVPALQQREVYASWDRGRGICTERYAAARRAAIEAVTP
jgi:hypothetical protein